MKTRSTNVRQTQDGPWCWQNKAARELIRTALDSSNTVASGLGVYDALTEIASDHQQETFTTTHAHISKHSGISVAGVKRRLRDLKEIGLVRIAPILKMPSSYTLLPIAHGELSIATDAPSIAHSQFQAPRATLEESERIKKESNKKGATAKPPLVLPFPSEGFATAWEQWVQFRKEKGKKLTDTTVKLQFKKFLEWGEAKSIKAIEHTILKGWTGLWEPDEPSASSYGKSYRTESPKREEGIGAGAQFVNGLAAAKAAVPAYEAEVLKIRDELVWIEKFPDRLPDFIRRVRALPTEASSAFTESQRGTLWKVAKWPEANQGLL